MLTIVRIRNTRKANGAGIASSCGKKSCMLGKTRCTLRKRPPIRKAKRPTNQGFKVFLITACDEIVVAGLTGVNNASRRIAAASSAVAMSATGDGMKPGVTRVAYM
jgi:hypothetical protein